MQYVAAEIRQSNNKGVKGREGKGFLQVRCKGDLVCLTCQWNTKTISIRAGAERGHKHKNNIDCVF